MQEKITYENKIIDSRNSFIDEIKGISIILVVIGHCIQYGSGRSVYENNSFFLDPVFSFIYSFHMPLFMLVSGYLFAFSVKKYSLKNLIKKKLNQLIFPLLSWAVISFCIKICTMSFEKSHNNITIIWMAKTLIVEFLTGPWFLWAVWWCSLVVIFTHELFNDNPIIYFLGFLITFLIPDFSIITNIIFVYPYFIIGYGFNTYENKAFHIIKQKKDNFVFCIIICFIFVLMLRFYSYDSYIYTSGFSLIGKDILYQIYIDIFRLIIGLIGSVAVFCLMYNISKIQLFHFRRLLSSLGKNSLGLYVISVIILNKLLYIITINANEVNYLYITIETVLIIVLSYYISEFIKKFKILNRLLLGGR